MYNLSSAASQSMREYLANTEYRRSDNVFDRSLLPRRRRVTLAPLRELRYPMVPYKSDAGSLR